MLSACGSESSPDAVVALPDAGPGDAGVLVPADAEPPRVGAASRACSSDAWCWDGAGPQGNALYAVAANSDNDVWAVGALGTLVHFNGEDWVVSYAPGRAALRALWVDGEEVWVVGDEQTVLERVDGEFQPVTLPELAPDQALHGVWGRSSGGRWIVGADGLLLERRDGVWSRVTLDLTTALNAVWANDGEVWAVGDAGVVFHHIDGAWSSVDAGTSQNLYAVSGRGTDVWLVGAGGEVRQFNREAQRWERPNGEGPAPRGELRAVQVAAGGRVHVSTNLGAVHTWDAAATCPVPGDAGAPETPCPQWSDVRATGRELPIHGLWVAGENAVAVGPHGAIVSWDGPSRSVIGEGSLDNYLDVSGSGSSEVWVAGDRVLTRGEQGWTEVVRDSPRAVYAVAALGSGRSLVAGTGGMARNYDGTLWQDMDVGADAWLRGLWSDGESGWLVGSRGRVWGLLNRRVWTLLSTPTDRDLLDVWSLPSGTTWAVGVTGMTLRHDGTIWAAVPTGPNGGLTVDLRGVWGSADDDVWAVGTNGAAVHWDGRVWTRATPDAPFALNDVWGRAANDIWAVGTGGTILHFDGQTWEPEFSGVEHTLNGVWGSAEQLWASGEHGTILVKSLTP